MKRLLIIALMAVSAISLTGCNKEDLDPVILGAESVSILQGTDFDEMEGITATDVEDGDLTDEIELDGFVNSMILGEHALTYIVEDSSGNTARVTIIITVFFEASDDNAVYNGDFSLGEAGWTFDKPGGEATFAVTNEELVVTITDLAQEWWNLQLHQSLSIEDGVTYKMSFDAKSTDDKRIGIGLEDTGDGYKMLPGGNVAFELTDEYATYEFYYTSDRTIDTGKFVLYLGRIGLDEELTTVYIDNIMMEEVTLDTTEIIINGADEANVVLSTEFDPLAGVTAEAGDGTDLTSSIILNNVAVTDLGKNATFVLQYSVTDGTTTLYHDRIVNVVLGKDDPSALFNTDFSFGTTGWSLDFPVGEGNMTVVDGVLEAELTDLGDAWWHIQLFQDGITIVEGKTYVITFEAKADGSKRIGLGIEDPADGYADLKGESVEWDLTTEWVTYEYTFIAPKSIDTAKYAIFLGYMVETDVPTTVYVDNFEVNELADSYPVLAGVANVEVVQGAGFTILDGVTATDFEDGDITANITTSGTFDIDTVGSYTVDYVIIDSFGNTTTVSRSINVVLEATEDYDVYNGDFSYGEFGWGFGTPGGTALFTVENDELKVDISSPGPEWWTIQVEQLISIETDVTYKISFDAKSAEGKNIGIGLEDTADGYVMLPGGDVAFDLTDTYQTFEYVYTSDRTIDTAKFVLYLGGIGTTDPAGVVYIDNINIEILVLDTSDIVLSGVDNADVIVDTVFDPLAGVTAVDGSAGDITANITVVGIVETNVAKQTTYVVQYIVTDGITTLYHDRIVTVVLGGNPWEMFNSGFDLGTLGWRLDYNETAAGTFEVVAGVLEVDISNVGSAFWHIQVYQDGRTIDMDTMYKVSFKAKADVVKRIELGIENPADGFADLKGEVVAWDLTTDWVTYEYIFNPSVSIDTAKYVILMGNITGTDPNTKVYIDDFMVTEYVANGAVSVVVNADMEDTTGWVFDFPGGTGTMTYTAGEIVAVLTDLSDAGWRIQLQQDGISIVEGNYYLISVDLKTDNPRRVGLGVEDTGDGYADLKGESIEWDITTEYQTFYYVLHANRTIDTAKLALFFGQITGTDPTGTIYIDNFNMVEANGLNILLNSDFEDNSTWNYDFNSGATGTMDAVSNTVEIALTDLASAWWNIQLYQQDASITNGYKYLVTFKASSDVDRRIELGIEDPANGWADLKGESVGWDINGDLRTYTYVFTSSNSIDTAKFAIFLGQITGTDPISNLVITDFGVFLLE